MKKQGIGLLLCMVMIGSSVGPASGTVLLKDKSSPLLTGTTLYVGGSGPNNYSKIQDAINDASDGDTVFVYDDSSPYFEALQITRSISLIGEEKHTTIIDSGAIKNTSTVNISADGVLVQGFTIQNCTSLNYWNSGIEIKADNVLIKGNIIKDNYFGIVVGEKYYYPGETTNHCSIDGNDIYKNHRPLQISLGNYSTISHNRITLNELGIWLDYSDNSNISTNEISENDLYGISLWGGTNNSIFQNNIIGNHGIGIYLSGSYKNFIFQNNITGNFGGSYGFFNGTGILLEDSFNNSIQQNNIYKNEIQSTWINTMPFVYMFIMKITPFDNIWDGNYWGRSYQLSKPVCGFLWFVVPRQMLTLFLHPLELLQMLLQGGIEVTINFPQRGLPIIKFDGHPAQEPYDIPGMS